MSTVVSNLDRTRGARALAIVALAGLFTTACDKAGEPTAPLDTFAAADFLPYHLSDPEVTPVTAVPQSRPYPGTKVQGQASVCKDASSPAGEYTFNIQVANAQSGDLVASSVTVSPGGCSIVYSRTDRTGETASSFTSVTVTEVIPSGAAYRLDSVRLVDDATGSNNLAGPSATIGVNAYHGGYANFFNAPAGTPSTPAVDFGLAAPTGSSLGQL